MVKFSGFCQIKGSLDDVILIGYLTRVSLMCDISSVIISCVEFNHYRFLLTTSDSGGIVIFQLYPVVSFFSQILGILIHILTINVLSSPEFQYLDKEDMYMVLSRVMNPSLISSSHPRLKRK